MLLINCGCGLLKGWQVSLFLQTLLLAFGLIPQAFRRRPHHCIPNTAINSEAGVLLVFGSSLNFLKLKLKIVSQHWHPFSLSLVCHFKHNSILTHFQVTYQKQFRSSPQNQNLSSRIFGLFCYTSFLKVPLLGICWERIGVCWERVPICWTKYVNQPPTWCVYWKRITRTFA